MLSAHPPWRLEGGTRGVGPPTPRQGPAPGLVPGGLACPRKCHPPWRLEPSFPPRNIWVCSSSHFRSNVNAPFPHSPASPLRLVLTSIKGEMMETIFMGMISIKYQLTWEPQPGVQCVKGKYTSPQGPLIWKSRTLIRFDNARIGGPRCGLSSTT